MRWTRGGTSHNVEDRRNKVVLGGLGAGGTIVALVLSLLFGRDIRSGSGAPARVASTDPREE